MKILLVGEYSRLHNSLKEGLLQDGHQVCLISTGDQFKKFPSDILLKRKYNSGILKKFKVGLYRLFGIDITSISIRNQFFKHRHRLQNFDVVQLINESSFAIAPRYEKEIAGFLAKHNTRLFLLSCGTDYTSITFAYAKKFRYSILTPFFEGRIRERDFSAVLKYRNPPYKKLHQFIRKNCSGIIASDMDYDLPLRGKKKYLGLLPNPVNTEKLKYIPQPIDDKIIIFHGVNRQNYYKKGNDYFDKALQIIQDEFPSQVKVMRVENLPYAEYITQYNQAHILLDQIFAYDQGYNALEAMAKGKVVFTGAETEFLKYYDLSEDEVCINALPEVSQLAQKLEELIANPEKIKQISTNARKFIETHHDFRNIADRYVQTWQTADDLDKK